MYVYSGIGYQHARAYAWRSQLIQEVRRDAAIYSIVVSYFLVMLVLSEWFGRRYWLTPTTGYLGYFFSIAALISVASFGWGLVGHFAQTRPRSPLKVCTSRLLYWATPSRVAGLFLYLSLAVFMGAFTTVKTLLPEMRPFWFDRTLTSLDRAIHGGARDQDDHRHVHAGEGRNAGAQA